MLVVTLGIGLLTPPLPPMGERLRGGQRQIMTNPTTTTTTIATRREKRVVHPLCPRLRPLTAAAAEACPAQSMGDVGRRPTHLSEKIPAVQEVGGWL